MINPEKLKTKSAYEKALADYLVENASETLQEHINASDKTIAGCGRYIINEARKRANGDSALAMTDAEVFGMVLHYFEEDSIKEKDVGKVSAEVKTSKPVKEEAKPEPEQESKPEPKTRKGVLENQISIFDLAGAEA